MFFFFFFFFFQAEDGIRYATVTGVQTCALPISFYRATSLPFILFPVRDGTGSLEEKVFASVDALAEGLAVVADRYDLLHSQDCISARAATRVRDAGAGLPVIRTVHHVDDFTTQALIDSQYRAIVE